MVSTPGKHKTEGTSMIIVGGTKRADFYNFVYLICTKTVKITEFPTYKIK